MSNRYQILAYTHPHTGTTMYEVFDTATRTAGEQGYTDREDAVLDVQDNEARDQALLDIAQKGCGVTTMEPRGRDCMDFVDVHVGQLQAMLQQAYAAGQAKK